METIVDNTLHFTSEAMQIDTVLVAAVLSVPILFLLIVYVFINGGKSEARIREKIKNEALKRIKNNQSLMDSEKTGISGKNKSRKMKQKDTDIDNSDHFLE